MEFVGAKALLATIEQTERKQPLVKRDFAVLEDRADRDGEGLDAVFALVDAGARGLASQFRDAVGVAIAAMGANRTVGPVQGFQMLAGFVGVAVNGVGKIGHRVVPCL